MKASYDVVIVGSGAGGGACGWALASQGIRVLILEAGPTYDPLNDYLLDTPQWEQSHFPHKPLGLNNHSFGRMQKLEDRWRSLRSWNHITGPMNPTLTRLGWKYHHALGVGGTTLRYAGEAHRINPVAMKMRSMFGVGADWPISYAELEPYYCQAEQQTGVAGPAEDNLRPRSQAYPVPAHQLSYASQKIKEGCRKLGVSLTPNPVAILSQPYAGRPACNYCGNCSHGCPISDKGSVDVTYLPKAVASGNCEIKALCRVVKINAGRSDKVKSILYTDAAGTESEIDCRAIVVSCGAIETARLLLLSNSNQAPGGLANESGQVGRNFMETMSWASSGLHPEPLASYRGIPVDSICWDFNTPTAEADSIGGFRLFPMVLEAGLNGPINYAQRLVPGWGREHKAEMRRVFGNALGVGAVGESLPNPYSFIDLDTEKNDQWGSPLARINSYLDENEVKRLGTMAQKSRELLMASGVETILEEFGTYDIFSSTHVFGTCRMGNNPEKSVVDKYGRSHRWKNLFVADASVFPSSGGGESPSLTIQALAIRTAEQIKNLFTRGEL